jgi:hypothetical protein
VWFCECTSFGKRKISAGRVPRYKCWKFASSSKREYVGREIGLLREKLFIEKLPLEPNPEEEPIFRDPFIVFDHLSVINNEEECRRAGILKLLIDLVPVFIALRFPICDYLKNSAYPSDQADIDYICTAQQKVVVDATTLLLGCSEDNIGIYYFGYYYSYFRS